MNGDSNEFGAFDTLQAQRRVEEILTGRSKRAKAKILTALAGQWLGEYPEHEQPEVLKEFVSAVGAHAEIETSIRQSRRKVTP